MNVEEIVQVCQRLAAESCPNCSLPSRAHLRDREHSVEVARDNGRVMAYRHRLKVVARRSSRRPHTPLGTTNTFTVRPSFSALTESRGGAERRPLHSEVRGHVRVATASSPAVAYRGPRRRLRLRHRGARTPSRRRIVGRRTAERGLHSGAKCLGAQQRHRSRAVAPRENRAPLKGFERRTTHTPIPPPALRQDGT